MPGSTDGLTRVPCALRAAEDLLREDIAGAFQVRLAVTRALYFGLLLIGIGSTAPFGRLRCRFSRYTGTSWTFEN